MLNKRTAQLAILVSILATGGMLAGCQPTQGTGAEAAQADVVGANSRLIDPADRKFTTDWMSIVVGSPDRLANVDPADRKFYTGALDILGDASAQPAGINAADRKFTTDWVSIVGGAPDWLANVDPADRKFFTDNLWISVGMGEETQRLESADTCVPIAPEDLLKVNPADRKFYVWSSSC